MGNATSLWERIGRCLLFGVFIALLAGRFTLDRISTNLPAVDLRWAMLGGIVAVGAVWYGGAATHLPARVTNPGTSLFIIWATWMAASTLWAQPGARVARSIEDQFFLTAFVLIAIVLIGWLPSSATRSLWKWVFLTALIYLAAALISGPGAQGRYSAFMGGPNIFVRIMIIGAVSAMFLALARQSLLALVAVPAFAFGAILSGSRGGLIAAATIVILSVVPLVRRLGPRRLAWLLVSVCGMYYLFARFTGGSLHTVIENRLLAQTLHQGYSSGRTAIVEDAWHPFVDHPFVGVGIDGYYAMQQSGAVYQYPHNLVLATAAEGGIVALVLLILAIGAFVSSATSGRPMNYAVLAALMAGGGMLFASLFSGDYYDSRFMWVLFALGALEANKRPAGPVRGSLLPTPAESRLG